MITHNSARDFSAAKSKEVELLQSAHSDACCCHPVHRKPESRRGSRALQLSILSSQVRCRMNRYTFGDVHGGRRGALSNEIAPDGDSDAEEERPGRGGRVDGEELMSKGVDRFDEGGLEIEAFNLQAEREEGGHFDANGNYVFRKGGNEDDAWISAMDEADMEKNIGEAAEAKKNRDALVNKNIDSAEKKHEVASQDTLKKRIVKYGAPRDTVSEAIQRLSGAAKGQNGSLKNAPLEGKRERKGGSGSNDQKAAAAPQKSKADIAAAKKQLLELIELADELLSSGVVSVYSMTFEALLNSLFEWEYKGADGNIHGPYSCSDIAKWKHGGYFTGAQSVQMRPCRKLTSVSGQKRQVSFTRDGEPAAKRAKKDETADLLGDLEDSDDDEEGGAEVAGVGSGLKEEARYTEAEEDIISFGWRLSEKIDFGPADAVMAPSSSSFAAVSAANDGDDDFGNLKRKPGGSSLRDDGGESD